MERKPPQKEENDEDFLFKKYKLTEDQVELFKKVRAHLNENSIKLSHERLIFCLLAKKTVEKTIKISKEFSEIIEKYQVDNAEITQELYDTNAMFRYFLELGNYFFTPRRTKDGCGMLFVRYVNETIDPKFWEKFEEIVEDEDENSKKSKKERTKETQKKWQKMGIQFFLKIFETFILNNPENASTGIYTIVDMKEISWSAFSVKNYNSTAGESMNVFKSFPCRIKKIMLINSPWIVRVIITLVKAIVSKKIRSRLSVYSSDLTEVFVLIDEEKFPKEFGGKDETYVGSNFAKYTWNIDVGNQEKATDE